ncbi:MAG: DNA-binding NtrC family response regulator [Candidatus Endobugula sp.]|jgi:DNA-binding NtrC family response regulator
MMTTEKKYSVLFVDDEKRILTALRSIFRREYDVHIANGGEEALAILAENEINVIVSDQRMPNMLGNELLAEVHKLYPKTMRLLLTGFMDKEAIIRTINEGEIYRFINKPWRNDEIHKTIAEAALASEFDVAEVIDHQAVNENGNTFLKDIAGNNPDQGIVMMGSSQELRNQIRQVCRQHDINIYGTQSIPQAVGVVSARSAIGVAIIELPVNTDEALQTISVLKEKRPELISIVLTNETDAETAVELINSGQVFRYLAKPLENDQLEKAIEQAFTRHHVLANHSGAKTRYKVEKTTRSITNSIKELFSSFGRIGKQA